MTKNQDSILHSTGMHYFLRDMHLLGRDI